MRTSQELQAKLEEAEPRAAIAEMYNAIGDCSVWEYWAGFANLLRWILEDIPSDRRMRGLRKRARANKNWQLAAMYSWMLEPPKPVISDEGRLRARLRANKTKGNHYVYADAIGTHVCKESPHRRDCELIEPEGPPVKRPNERIRKDLRPAMVRRQQAERSLG